jgi:hypothetical protein
LDRDAAPRFEEGQKSKFRHLRQSAVTKPGLN